MTDWNVDGVRLILGDCIEVMRGMDDNSIPLIIADPPYGIGYHSNHYKDKNPHAPVANDWNFQIGSFLQECNRVLVDGGALYLFCRWDVQPLWIPYVKAAGLKVKTVIAWVKDNWSAGDLKGSFGNQYEQIIFAAKGRHLIRGHRWSNVWEFPRVPHVDLLHPTEKPVPLLQRAVESSSDEGDVVLDPFAGSGSTGEACINTNRVAVLADIDPKMIDIAANRLGINVPSKYPSENEKVDPRWQSPDPLEWGIHPEDMRQVIDIIKGNAERKYGVGEQLSLMETE